MAPSSALAGAFQRNVQDAPASVPGEGNPATIELSVTDEWYVAINGVPVGPVRISELRRKAAAGAVTEESLCWQEGLEEWRPIRSIPELAALVREAAQGNRPSLIGAPPEPPAGARSPSIPSAPRVAAAPAVPATSRISTVPAAPRPMAPSAPSTGIGGRSNVVPLRPAAASSPLDDLMSSGSRPDLGSRPGTGSGAAATALAAPALAPTPSPLFPPQSQPLSNPMMPIAPAVDPFAVPSPLGAPPPYSRDSGIGMAPLAAPAPLGGTASPSVMPAPPTYDQGGKRGVPLWFWPILVVALGFGGGVAFLVFRPQPTPAPVVIQMPPTATAQPTAVPTDIPPPTVASDTAPATSETKPGVKVASRPTAKPNGTTEEKKGIDLGNLVGPNGGGPNVGPGGGGGAAGGGGLDQAGVERVVAGHRAGVKRTCWERGGADQKSSVNVTISANVAPNGSVASTSSTGDDPVVAKCIENQVKTWQFPAPGSSTTINIPFKFVRQ